MRRAKAMYNLLLDPLPEEYEGYLIRTDYRIGIQISQVLADEELEWYEQLDTAFHLLYGEGMPPADTAMSGLQWFLNGGQLQNGGESSRDGDGIDYFSFDYDAARLYSAFRRTYGVELDRITLHWFRFLSMFGDLGDCALTQIIDFRTADLAKMDKETKKIYIKMRRRFALPQPQSREELEFMQKLGLQ